MTNDTLRITHVSVLPGRLALHIVFGDQLLRVVDLTDWITNTKALARLQDQVLFSRARAGEYGTAVVWIEDELELAADNLRTLAEEQLPFSLKVPNAETRAALIEADEIIAARRARFNSADDLVHHLEDKKSATQESINAIIERLELDPGFAKDLLAEAATFFLNGEPDAARLILRDIVGATVGFETLAELTHTSSENLHKMLSHEGPSMDTLVVIFDGVRNWFNVKFDVRVIPST